MPRKSNDHGSILEDESCHFRVAELIHRYFENKRYYIGGPIPNSMLFSEQSVLTVLKCSFENGFVFVMDYLNENCLPKLRPDSHYKDPTVSWTSHFVLQLLSEMMSLEIPQNFKPGLMLLYFKFCKGMKIPDLSQINYYMEECKET